MNALNKCVEVGCKTKRPPSGSRFYRVLKFSTISDGFIHVRLDKPQEFIQVARRGGQDSAVSSSFASPIALRTSLATMRNGQPVLSGDPERCGCPAGTFQRGFAVDNLSGPQSYTAQCTARSAMVSR